MARKITVLGENRQVKKAVASLLVRKAVAEWVVEHVTIRIKPLREYNFRHSVKLNLPRKPYIPAKLPPAEVGGCHFVAPLKLHDPANTIVRLVRIQHGC